MVYTNEKFNNAPTAFPEPPQWLVWVAQGHWDYKARTWIDSKGEGIVRHMNGLFKAKRYVRGYNRDEKWAVNWAIYLWDAEKKNYVLQYSGKKGDRVGDNELMRTVVRKGDPNLREVAEDELEEVLASIAKASA